MKELNQKLAVIQTKLKAKKSSYNSFGKYHFRKSEDILEAIKPFLIEHGVTVTINEEIIATDPVPTMQSTATQCTQCKFETRWQHRLFYIHPILMFFFGARGRSSSRMPLSSQLLSCDKCRSATLPRKAA